MMRIVTKRDLMEALQKCNDNDQVVIDVEDNAIEGDLYEFSVFIVPNVQMADGSKINEIRLVPCNWLNGTCLAEGEDDASSPCDADIG